MLKVKLQKAISQKTNKEYQYILVYVELNNKTVEIQRVFLDNTTQTLIELLGVK